MISCSGDKKKDQQPEDQDSLNRPLLITDTIVSRKDFPLIISDSNWTQRYNKDFFNGYRKSKYTLLQLQDNFIVLDKADTALFPGIPEIGRNFSLKSTFRETTIQLNFIRKNYTTIQYTLEFSHPRKKNFQISGIAHLHPDFFLRIDSDRSTTSGATYNITEFEDLTKKSCPARIRIGYEEISGSGIQAKISRKCNGSYGEITSENFPTLIEIR